MLSGYVVFAGGNDYLVENAGLNLLCDIEDKIAPFAVRGEY